MFSFLRETIFGAQKFQVTSQFPVGFQHLCSLSASQWSLVKVLAH